MGHVFKEKDVDMKVCVLDSRNSRRSGYARNRELGS